MKKIIYFILATVAFSGCKNENSKKTSDKKPIDTTAFSSSILQLGCYTYNANNDNINFEITSVENGITGNLNYVLNEKDSNSGTFIGKINGEHLIGTYEFMSEGLTSKREVAFLIKDNQLIEGYGKMDESGTSFVDKTKISYTSTMPLSKTNCDDLQSDCLFINGKAYSNLRQKCIALSDLKTKLNPIKDGAMTSGDAAFIIFDETQSKAELFLPNTNKGLVMLKENEGNWKNGDYYLIAWKGYVIQYKGKPIFGGA